MKYSAYILLILIPLFICAQPVDPVYITLNGAITDPDQEVSGLAWYNDNLILLPQYPADVIYSIPKIELLEFLDSDRQSIMPSTIGWNANGIEKKIPGFEGFESIAFSDDQVYLTIEAEIRNSNYGYLVKGNIAENTIEIKTNTLIKIKTPVHLRNMTYETILLAEESIIVIYEVNSKEVNPNPIYYQFDYQLNNFVANKFPYIDYRLTDATELDHNNTFWAINYFWPGDYKLLKPDLGYPITNTKDIRPVERLLEFELLSNSIVRTETPPLNIKLDEFGESRNWEGIVSLDNRGFLIVTDKFPGTVLAFIPYTM